MIPASIVQQNLYIVIPWTVGSGEWEVAYAKIDIETSDPRLTVIAATTVAGIILGYIAGGIAGAFLGGFAGLVGGCLAAAIIDAAISEIQRQASYIYQYQYS